MCYSQPVIRLVATPERPPSDRIYDLLADLDEETLPDDDPCPLDERYWWVAYHQGEAIAFAGLKVLPVERLGFLCRAGVIPEYRGRGLQRRFIHIRDQLSVRLRLRGTITYVSSDNRTSAANLIRCGYLPYVPPYKWGPTGAIYLYRNLGYEGKSIEQIRRKIKEGAKICM